MKGSLLVLCIVLMSAGVAMAQVRPAGPTPVDVQDNLFLEAGAGWMMMPGENSNWLAYGGARYGFALCDPWGLGAQIGGQVRGRDHRPDYIVSAGIFQRGRAFAAEEAAWALQGIYMRTWRRADLFALKPVLGMELTEDSYLALTGWWGLNTYRVQRTPTREVQDITDTAMLVWGSRWLWDLQTELGVGYQWGGIRQLVVGLHTGWMLDDITSLNLTGQVNMDGDYYAAVNLGFDLGRRGRNATFNTVGTEGGTTYMPFPTVNLPVPFYETRSSAASGGGF